MDGVAVCSFLCQTKVVLTPPPPSLSFFAFALFHRPLILSGDLRSLAEVHISRCNLVTLPASVGRLRKLVILIIRFNNIEVCLACLAS